ncbi:hypothetical protein KIPB_000755 [Kipferlia bialata]|uniref:Uncharacterized protein n=1 Tax=Kipferlia bialata TaxID=797122 RepID=A0A9K3CR09_9EUKA|nr:hypothetical protein KIPB_000755 [Kipferlia bialata]|eukprot:g755.t1
MLWLGCLAMPNLHSTSEVLAAVVVGPMEVLMFERNQTGHTLYLGHMLEDAPPGSDSLLLCEWSVYESPLTGTEPIKVSAALLGHTVYAYTSAYTMVTWDIESMEGCVVPMPNTHWSDTQTWPRVSDASLLRLGPSELVLIGCALCHGQRCTEVWKYTPSDNSTKSGKWTFWNRSTDISKMARTCVTTQVEADDQTRDRCSTLYCLSDTENGGSNTVLHSVSLREHGGSWRQTHVHGRVSNMLSVGDRVTLCMDDGIQVFDPERKGVVSITKCPPLHTHPTGRPTGLPPLLLMDTHLLLSMSPSQGDSGVCARVYQIGEVLRNILSPASPSMRESLATSLSVPEHMVVYRHTSRATLPVITDGIVGAPASGYTDAILRVSHLAGILSHADSPIPTLCNTAQLRHDIDTLVQTGGDACDRNALYACSALLLLGGKVENDCGSVSRDEAHSPSVSTTIASMVYDGLRQIRERSPCVYLLCTVVEELSCHMPSMRCLSPLLTIMGQKGHVHMRSVLYVLSELAVKYPRYLSLWVSVAVSTHGTHPQSTAMVTGGSSTPICVLDTRGRSYTPVQSLNLLAFLRHLPFAVRVITGRSMSAALVPFLVKATKRRDVHTTHTTSAVDWRSMCRTTARLHPVETAIDAWQRHGSVTFTKQCAPHTVSGWPAVVKTSCNTALLIGQNGQTGQDGGRNCNCYLIGVCGDCLTWEPVRNPLPPSLFGTSATVIGGVVYVFGGMHVVNGATTYSNTLYTLDLASLTWTVTGEDGSRDWPRGRHGGAYTFRDGERERESGRAGLLKRQAKGEGVSVSHLCSAELDGMLLITGGISGDSCTSVRDTHVYDPISCTWAGLDWAPVPLAGASVHSTEGGVHFFGSTLYPRSHLLLTVGGEWHTQPDLPFHLTCSVCVPRGRSLLFIGGVDHEGVHSMDMVSGSLLGTDTERVGESA